jgi:cation-transporting ATPase 13A2
MIRGDFVGDPVDVAMFQSSEWIFDESPDERHFEIATIYPPDVTNYIMDLENEENEARRKSSVSSISETSSDDNSAPKMFKNKAPYMLAIVKRFDFDSKLARMSVIVKNKKDNSWRSFTKGAPEYIRRLCNQDSVPSTFHDILKKYTERGLRVIALAYRDLYDVDYYDIMSLKRENVECELKFLGFVLLNNELKPETIPTINTLHNARIKTAMATGDNPLTSISVARECGIIDSSLPVYLGELVTLKSGEILLTWNDIDKLESKLDPKTLVPLDFEEEEFKRNYQFFKDSNSTMMLNRDVSQSNFDLINISKVLLQFNFTI